MKTVTMKTFKTHQDFSNEVQRRAEIILGANRINQRKLDFEEVFFIGKQKGFITFKTNRYITIARFKEDHWVSPEPAIAAAARFLADKEIRATGNQSFKTLCSQLEAAHKKFTSEHDNNY